MQDLPGDSVVKNLPAMQETQIWSLGWKIPLEKEMATHSSILGLGNPMDRGAWRTTGHEVANESDTTEQLNNMTILLLVSPCELVPLASMRRAWFARVTSPSAPAALPLPSLLPYPGVGTDSNSLRVSPEIYKLSATAEGNYILLLLLQLLHLSEIALLSILSSS